MGFIKGSKDGCGCTLGVFAILCLIVAIMLAM